MKRYFSHAAYVICNKLQGDSLARGPKLLSIKIMLLILKAEHFQHRL